MKYWHIRGNKDDLRCSLVSMLILYETCFNPPWIVPVRVTKLPTTFFMFTKVPSTYLDQWLALSTNFPREYTCSLTKNWYSYFFRKWKAFCENDWHQITYLTKSFFMDKKMKEIDFQLLPLDGRYFLTVALKTYIWIYIYIWSILCRSPRTLEQTT